MTKVLTTSLIATICIVTFTYLMASYIKWEWQEINWLSIRITTLIFAVSFLVFAKSPDTK